MQIFKKITIAILTVFYFLIFSACGEDNIGESEQEINTAKIVNEWKVGDNGEVRRDNSLLSADFQNFTIRFSAGNSYVVQNDPMNVFQPSGTWRFAEGTFSEIILNSDRRPLSVEYSNNDEILILRFRLENDQPIGSRSIGLSGSYEFLLNK